MEFTDLKELKKLMQGENTRDFEFEERTEMGANQLEMDMNQSLKRSMAIGMNSRDFEYSLLKKKELELNNAGKEE